MLCRLQKSLWRNSHLHERFMWKVMLKIKNAFLVPFEVCWCFCVLFKHFSLGRWWSPLWFFSSQVHNLRWKRPGRRSGYPAARVLNWGKSHTLKPSVPAAERKLPGTDINHSVKRETGRHILKRETEWEMSVCVWVRETGGRLSLFFAYLTKQTTISSSGQGSRIYQVAAREEQREKGGRKAQE